MAQEKLDIFFDFDGTLIDITRRHYDVYSNIIEELGGRPLNQKNYWQLKRGKTAWQHILERSGINFEVHALFTHKFVQEIETPQQLAKDKLFPGVKELLASLDGHNLFLVSLRRSKKELHNELERLGILHFFREIICGFAEVDPHNLKAKLIKSRAKSQKAILVGDTEADILAAHELGFTSVAVTTGIRNAEILQELKPTHIANSIPEIREYLNDAVV